MFAKVVIDAVISNDDKVFDYFIPESLRDVLNVGARVFVPFGPRSTEGFVLELDETTKIPKDKLKEIIKVPDEFTAIKPEILEIAPRICEQFKLRLIDVLRLFVPATVRGRKRTRKVQNKELKSLDIKHREITLTSQQQKIVDEITKSSNQTFVLHGVTGSGKTEVYMHIISNLLEIGKSAIMMVPEIGLTPQVLANFRSRFGDKVAMIHSGLSPTERYDQWLRLHTSEAKIVIGPRSAVFSPLENLGVIILDEEHDTSYFSESNPRFSTHEIAKIRAKFNNCPIVLGSATPSIQTMFEVENGNYKLLKLPKRIGGLEMPSIQIVDMVAEIRSGHGGIFSRDLLSALVQTIEDKRQAMIFLNRRGFSSSVMCKSCGWVAGCDSCDVSLVWHKDDAQLKCHYCQARYTAATTCKQCGSSHLRYGSIGTQKVVEELQRVFPNVPTFRLDTDNTTSKDSLVQILNDFSLTSPSILVGTQMIAKGHHFPLVSVVGVLEADNSLHFADYRATERSFSLITQVAGRAGRDKTSHEKEKPSVFIQTYRPKHYVYQLAANYDYDKFYEKEINTRQTTKFPPFTTIVRVLVTSEIDTTIKDIIMKIMAELKPRAKDFIYLAAMRSPLGRIQNKFRYQILARFDRKSEYDMIDFIDKVVKKHQTNKVQIFMEINPQNLS